MHDERKDAIGMAEDSLNGFEQIYKGKWLAMMGSKLGLAEAKKEDESLVTGLLDWMHENGADYTNTFRDLSQKELPNKELYATESFQAWHAPWQARLREEDLESSLALR
ncbi:MAG: protein adenylyltransferase SelO family protein, partial [Opitutae bacterium]